MEGDSLPRGYLSTLARKYNVHRSTTTRWFQRTTERSYVVALHASSSTIHRLRKKGRFRTHTSTNYPALTDNHKIARLKWVLSFVNPIPVVGDPTFRDRQQTIHIDEKWFYLNLETRTFYLLPNEEDPYRAQQSKSFKLKAMFMGMIGKPMYDEHKNLLHDGKYGLFPFVKYEVAKKKSKNRDNGTLETKSIQYQSFPKNLDELIEKVEESFDESDPTVNKYTWITLQSCMLEILAKKGGNDGR
ncbi:uncharacterized protein LOC110687692 [Chenopodium quinoa]|uniref:uncharacterized protein LOC110687692 n=1 Tax=Chenopodium quinoa TaxID=63459 RepID=UPI000B78A564|nr:uncharacterized protein LOC110687692 [Chenopodium quinoa]